MTTQELAVRDQLVERLRSPEFKEQVGLALPEHVSPDRFVRATVTAIMQNPDVLKADRASLFQSVLKSAQDGLVPDGREAALVLFFDKKSGVEMCQYLPMIAGLRKIAADHGWAIRTAVVYENDDFDFELGLEPSLSHRPVRPGVDRGKPIAAYAVGSHKDGRKEFEVMDAADIDRVRQVSRAKDRGPWVDWTDRMWEKTVGHRLFAKLPLGEIQDDRVARMIDLAPGEAQRLLYGPPRNGRALDAPRSGVETASAPVPQADAPGPPQGNESGASAPSDFDGEEPGDDNNPFQPPVGVGLTPEAVAANQAGDVTFTAASKKHNGKTVREVWDTDPGYIEFCLSKWKTEPIKSAVAAFTRVYAPEMYQKALAKQETAA